MRSMIAVLLLGAAVMAQPQPQPFIDTLLANIDSITALLKNVGGHRSSVQNERGHLEGLLGANDAVGGLDSDLVGPLLRSGGLLGGLLGGGLLGGGVSDATGQVGDLVTCILSQVLGQVRGLHDQICDPVLMAHGLSVNPVDDLIDRLTELIEISSFNRAQITNAITQEDIAVIAALHQLLNETLTRDFVNKVIETGGGDFTVEELAQFISSENPDLDGLMKLFIEGDISADDLGELVRSGVIAGQLQLGSKLTTQGN